MASSCLRGGLKLENCGAFSDGLRCVGCWSYDDKRRSWYRNSTWLQQNEKLTVAFLMSTQPQTNALKPIRQLLPHPTLLLHLLSGFLHSIHLLTRGWRVGKICFFWKVTNKCLIAVEYKNLHVLPCDKLNTPFYKSKTFYQLFSSFQQLAAFKWWWWWEGGIDNHTEVSS